MPKTLFVNACMRKEASRTLKLCREFLAGCEEVAEVDLATMHLAPFDAAMLEVRSALEGTGNYDDALFDLSHQFAQADEIVIGAPYWDQSFPAALKIYFEHVSVCNIPFIYTSQGECVGQCKAKTLTYITTCGGYLQGANYGYDYVCGIARMFGIPEVRLVAAEGLDIVGMDIEAQMDKARKMMRP
ncbi:MAG: NAD(P)H-dependent oxidoreductase [Raoultibacter sp.]